MSDKDLPPPTLPGRLVFKRLAENDRKPRLVEMVRAS